MATLKFYQSREIKGGISKYAEKLTSTDANNV